MSGAKEHLAAIKIPAARRTRVARFIKASSTAKAELYLVRCGDFAAVSNTPDFEEMRVVTRNYINVMAGPSCSGVSVNIQAEAISGFAKLVAQCTVESEQLKVVVTVVQCEEKRRVEPRSAMFETLDRSSPVRRTIVAKPPVSPDIQDQSLEDRIRSLLSPPAYVELDNVVLAKEPKPFQCYGIQWIMGRCHALLADEMGLGKTMQAIVAARLLWRRRDIHTVLIVCPAPLVDNWCREIELWWPSISRGNVHVCRGGPGRMQWLRMATDRHVVKIISYPMLARSLNDLQDLAYPIRHDLMIIDEAQTIKNPRSNTSKAVKALTSARRWALTGTPLENRLSDLVSIFEFVKPGLIHAHDVDDVERIREVVADCMLRRRAKDVLDELPGLDQQEVGITLRKKQLEAYKRLEREGVASLNEQGDSVTVANVFSLIARLRKMCNYDESSKESAKRTQLWADLQEIMADGDKALVFCEFVEGEFGLLGLSKYLRQQAREAFEISEIYGGYSAGKRNAIIAQFQKMARPGVLLIQYRAGGVGLNLQQASHVFLFDRWWNPAVEDQAIGRAHRLGQQSVVLAKKYMCVDTIEERIVAKINEKRRLFVEVVGEGDFDPANAMGLSQEEFFELFDGLTARPKHLQKTSATNQRWESLSPGEFEHIVAKMYRHKGYDVEVCGGANDRGVDVVIRHQDRGGLHTLGIVQCKRLRAPCGPEPVRGLGGTTAFGLEVTHRILALWGEATREAKMEANRHGIVILEGKEIREYCIQHSLLDA